MLETEIAPVIRMVSERLQALDATILASFPPAAYIQELDGIPPYSRYGQTTPIVDSTCREIARRAGQPALEDYHRLILLTLIREFDARIRKKKYPEHVVELFANEFQRMTSEIAAGVHGSYLYSSDFFCKDLAMCRQRLIPCGGPLIDPVAGIPRSWLLKGPLPQKLRMARMIRRLGSFRTVYQLHNDRRQVGAFNPAGWDAAYGIAAALMELNPEVRGLVGGTWWYDPEVSRMSPNLGYLRDVPERCGAEFFCLGEHEDTTRDALTNSLERWRCYAQGTYQPMTFAMIWDREGLLRAASVHHWT